MDEFDPIPPVSPVFRGLVVAGLLVAIALCILGAACAASLLIVAVLT